MAIYPEVTKRLRDEVLATHGAHNIPTYESLRSLKYSPYLHPNLSCGAIAGLFILPPHSVRAVLNETLRLFPPVPLNVRESRPEACALPPSSQASALSSFPPLKQSIPSPKEHLYMPGSTPIMFMPLLMQRNPDLWGADADVFDPDRWLDPKRISMVTANPMMYTALQRWSSDCKSLPRISRLTPGEYSHSSASIQCVGQNFAYNEASFFLVKLLQQFDSFTLAPEFQPEGSLPPDSWKQRQGRQAIEKCWPSAALTLYVKGGLWVRFGKSDRSDS